MKRILILTLFLFSLNLYSRAEGIVFFHGTFAEAKAEAAKQHKLIFMDCFTTWCGPCREMSSKAFPDKSVGDYFNAHFICMQMDMEKGEGVDIRKQYGVEAFPTSLFLNDSGIIQDVHVGYRSTEQFIESGKTALDEKNNFMGLEKRFKSGENDTSFLKKFIAATYERDLENGEIALKKYWDVVPESDLYKEENFHLFQYYEKDINSKPYKFIFAHQNEFLEKYVSKNDYSQYGKMAKVAVQNDSDIMYLKAAQAIKIALDKNDTILFKQAKNIAMQSKYDESRYIVCVTEIPYCKLTGRWGDFLKETQTYLSENGAAKPYLYNGIAWSIYEDADDQTALLKALEYSETSLKYSKDYNNEDTYAHVLYKLKRYDEALKAANEAIELAKKSNQDPDSSNDLLKQIHQSTDAKTGN